MKQNQNFMISYFLFIFICFLFKAFDINFNDTELEKIILGITITSSIFVFADYCFYLVNEFNIIQKIYKKGIDTIKSSMVNKEDALMKIQNFEKKINLRNRLSMIFSCLGTMFMILGLVFFYFILAFSNFAQFFVKIQDIITMGSFCLIIFLQIIRPIQIKYKKILNVKILKDIKNCEK